MTFEELRKRAEEIACYLPLGDIDGLMNPGEGHPWYLYDLELLECDEDAPGDLHWWLSPLGKETLDIIEKRRKTEMTIQWDPTDDTTHIERAQYLGVRIFVMVRCLNHEKPIHTWSAYEGGNGEGLRVGGSATDPEDAMRKAVAAARLIAGLRVLAEPLYPESIDTLPPFEEARRIAGQSLEAAIEVMKQG